MIPDPRPGARIALPYFLDLHTHPEGTTMAEDLEPQSTIAPGGVPSPAPQEDPFSPSTVAGPCPSPQQIEALRAGIEQFVGGPGIPGAEEQPPVPQGHARYQFFTCLGRGGMGEVWRGYDHVMRRDVALKVVRRGIFRSDAMTRLGEEARIGGHLDHPRIVPVYDLAQLPDGRPFFVMKRVEGRNLAELLDARPDPHTARDRWLRVFDQVCEAVAFAHGRNVLYRDLKPSNVMVGPGDEVQVLDWGIAKMLSHRADPAEEPSGDPPPPGETGAATDTVGNASGSAPTRTGEVKGTVAFMAPEQALGHNSKVSTRSDVFGLGGILCVLLTGQPPYEGENGDDVLRQAERANLTPAFGRLARCGADSDLIALARQCLAADPADRPADAAEVRRTLESCRQIQRLRASLPAAGPLTRLVEAHPFPLGVLLLLLPHALGAGLDMTYNLLWAASSPRWGDTVGQLAWLLGTYTGVALLVTGIVTVLMVRPVVAMMRRLESAAPPTEAEVVASRRWSSKLYVLSLSLSALGWLPGGIVVPLLLAGMVGRPVDVPMMVQFLLSFSIAGLLAMTYCTLATEYLLLRIAYPRLWRVPERPADAVASELRGVSGRLLGMPLLAALAPLTASVAVLVNQMASEGGRLFQWLAIGLVVLGMLGCGVAGLMAHYLRGIVGGLLGVAGGDATSNTT